MERARRPDHRPAGRAGGRQEFLGRVPVHKSHARRARAAGRARRRGAADARDAGARPGAEWHGVRDSSDAGAGELLAHAVPAGAPRARPPVSHGPDSRGVRARAPALPAALRLTANPRAGRGDRRADSRGESGGRWAARRRGCAGAAWPVAGRLGGGGRAQRPPRHAARRRPRAAAAPPRSCSVSQTRLAKWTR